MDPRTPLSPHFTLAEMTVSRTAVANGIDNTPNDAQLANLKRLCMGYLEPARQQVGPIIVTSGFRCPQLNALDGGSPTSAHPDGRGGDHHSPRLSVYELMRWWVEKSGLPFDQVIFEYAAWVHTGIAVDGAIPRRQALMCFPGMKKPDGSVLYLPWDPNKVDPQTGLLKTAA